MKALAAWILFGGLGTVLAAAEPARQPFWKDVRSPWPPDEEAILGAVLDSEVYRVTPWDYADLRLLAPDGAEVAYSIEKATETKVRTVREPVAGRVVKLDEQASNRLEVVWEVVENDASSPSGFRFETPLHDFERRVTVTGEGASGSLELVSEALLYDYTRFMDVRGTEVRVPTNSFRRFRIAIQDITDEQSSRFRQLSRTTRDGSAGSQTENVTLERRPMRIDGIGAWRDKDVEQTTRDRRAAYAVEGFDVAEDAGRQQTVLTIRCRREPLTALSIETDSRNFSRACDLEAESEPASTKGAWVTLARGTLSSFQFRSYATNSLQIGFSEQRGSRYRLVIHNGDNPPLKITGVRAEGNVYRLVFLYAPGVALRLHYGLETLKRPQYDTAAVLGALRKGNAVVEVGLAPEMRDAGVASGGVNWRRLLNSRLVFGAGVLTVVAALGWGLYRAAKTGI